MEAPLILLLLLYAVGVPVAALVALSRTGALQRRLRELEARLAVGGEAGLAEPPPAADAASGSGTVAPETPPSTTAAGDAVPESSAGTADRQTGSAAGVEAQRDRAAEDEAAVPGPAWARRAGTRRPATRDEAASKWLVWVGGVALALGGVFLVKYAVDEGLLSPLVRILLGLLAGTAMISAAEALRSRHAARPETGPEASLVPSVVAGAGLVTVFASVFAAETLYGLVAPGLAFLLMAGVALGAVALSLLHGPAIAALGLVGAIIVPALVPSENPDAFSLFAYLGAIVAVMVTAAHYRRWGWLGWAALGGGTAWALFWMAVAGTALKPAATGAFVVFLAAVPLWRAPQRVGGNPLLSPDSFWRWPPFLWGAVSSMLAFVLVRVDLYGPASLAALGAVSVLYLAGTWLAPARLALAVASAGAVLAALGTWDVPAIVPADYAPGLDVLGGPPVAAPEFATFTTVAIAFAALYGLTGFAALGRVRFSDFWATVSAAMPVLLLALAYWRWTDFETSQGWGAAAVVLAGAYVFAAARVGRSRGPLGAYATACVAALSLAMAMVLREAWLTVALAVQLPAIAWIAGRLDLRLLRHVALGLAAVALVRLVFNPYLLDYDIAATPVFNWILYGYGIPAAAFWLAARRFLKVRDDLTVQVLEGGAVAFATLLASLQIRHLFAGAIDAGYDDLWEISLHSAVWVAVSYALYRAPVFAGRAALRWASAALRVAGAAQIVLFHLLIHNPAWDRVYVGNWPLANALGLAYLLPAVFAALYARAARARGDRPTAIVAALFAVALSFAYISFEVMRAFRGAVPYDALPTEGERYAYSVAWLAYAGVVLGLGLLWASRWLRYAALAVLLLTTAKVFVVDMEGLTGVLRALSFLGLGAVLVAIGYLFQRFMLPGDGPEQAEAADRPPG